MSARRKNWHDYLTTARSLLETALDAVTWVGLFIVGAVLIYVMVGVIGGSLFRVPQSEVARLSHSMNRVTDFMLYAAVIVAFVATIRTKEAKAEVGGAVVLGAVFLWFAFPWIVSYAISVKAGQTNDAVKIAIEKFALTGKAMLFAMIWPVLQFLWAGIRKVPLRKAQDEEVSKARLRREPPKKAKPATKPHFLSPCWHLPYCRDYLVELCPAYKARRRCWKFGGGCFCDQRLIEAMLTGMSRGARGTGEQAYLRSELDARNTVARHRSGRTPCKKCFIYLEHEKLKYEVMHPLAYPAAAAIIYFGYEHIIKEVWFWFQATLTNLWRQLAFQAVRETPESMREVFGMEAAAVMFAILLGMFLLLGLLRLCELWCFKWKL